MATAHQACIGDGVAVFVPEGYDPQRTPSFAFAAPLQETGEVTDNWTLKPRFTRKKSLAGVVIDLPEGTSLYGTGEVHGPLLRSGQAISLWNTDNFRYEYDSGRRLYQSHPWVLGVRADGTAFGVIFDTTWKGELTTGTEQIVLRSEGAPFRVVVIDRDSPQAVVRELAELTGKMSLPPRWALGFQQSRYSYYPDAKVREIADELRARRLPCDVIWIDIDYMDGFRVFTFDPERFPNPKATNDYLHDNDFHSVWMIDPGVKLDPGYAVYDSGTEKDLWIQKKDRTTFEGEVWPGMCVFPDFTMPAVRSWWADLYKDFLPLGIDGVWNDMNEPAVFKLPDGTMPDDNHHRGGGELPAGPHLLYHNVYGMLMTKATREGILATRPECRPFVLTRSNYLGGQRYAATWTGDNTEGMASLEVSIPMSINLGLSGQPFSGPDLGGYADETTPQMFGKWITLAPFFPFSRAHTVTTNPPREPWAFGPEIESISRTSLERRYRLLPYLYTLMERASRHGDPIMQPVFFADPKDATLREEDTAFLFGPDLLVVPTWAIDSKLPSGIWRPVSLFDDQREADGYQAALKIRGGAIIPLGQVVQSTNEQSLDPLTLLVCLDENGQAAGELYEDAGEGFDYRDGAYARTRYSASSNEDVVTVKIDSHSGDLPSFEGDVQVRVITEAEVLEGEGHTAAGIQVAIP